MTDIQHLRNILNEFKKTYDLNISEAEEFVDSIEEEFKDLEDQIDDRDEEIECLKDQLDEYEGYGAVDECYHLGLDTVHVKFESGNIKIRSLVENAMKRISV